MYFFYYLSYLGVNFVSEFMRIKRGIKSLDYNRENLYIFKRFQLKKGYVGFNIIIYANISKLINLTSIIIISSKKFKVKKVVAFSSCLLTITIAIIIFKISMNISYYNAAIFNDINLYGDTILQ